MACESSALAPSIRNSVPRTLLLALLLLVAELRTPAYAERTLYSVPRTTYPTILVFCLGTESNLPSASVAYKAQHHTVHQVTHRGLHRSRSLNVVQRVQVQDRSCVSADWSCGSFPRSDSLGRGISRPCSSPVGASRFFWSTAVAHRSSIVHPASGQPLARTTGPVDQDCARAHSRASDVSRPIAISSRARSPLPEVVGWCGCCRRMLQSRRCYHGTRPLPTPMATPTPRRAAAPSPYLRTGECRCRSVARDRRG